MKKFQTAILAIVLALGTFAFTKANTIKQTSYYWFPLDATSGNPQNVSSMPTLQASDPLGCSGILHFCGGGYSAFTNNGDGTYSASGARQQTDKKP